MIIIDNYDSFTYNIVEYVKILGLKPKFFKNDEISILDIEKINFSSIIISPGAGNPCDGGICADVIKKFYKTKKILAVCLGHQIIATCFGAKVIQAKEPCHGKTSKIYFKNNERLFLGFNQGFNATRYHSLIVDNNSLNQNIIPIAWTKDNLIMGIKIEGCNLFGVQFHPESILTNNGINLIKNFIEL